MILRRNWLVDVVYYTEVTASNLQQLKAAIAETPLKDLNHVRSVWLGAVYRAYFAGDAELGENRCKWHIE